MIPYGEDPQRLRGGIFMRRHEIAYECWRVKTNGQLATGSWSWTGWPLKLDPSLDFQVVGAQGWPDAHSGQWKCGPSVLSKAGGQHGDGANRDRLPTSEEPHGGCRRKRGELGKLVINPSKFIKLVSWNWPMQMTRALYPRQWSGCSGKGRGKKAPFCLVILQTAQPSPAAMI